MLADEEALARGWHDTRDSSSSTIVIVNRGCWIATIGAPDCGRRLGPGTTELVYFEDGCRIRTSTGCVCSLHDVQNTEYV